MSTTSGLSNPGFDAILARSNLGIVIKPFVGLEGLDISLSEYVCNYFYKIDEVEVINAKPTESTYSKSIVQTTLSSTKSVQYPRVQILLISEELLQTVNTNRYFVGSQLHDQINRTRMLKHIGNDILYEILKFSTEEMLLLLMQMDERLSEVINIVFKERLQTFYSPFVKCKKDLDGLVEGVIQNIYDSQDINLQDDMCECKDDFFADDMFEDDFIFSQNEEVDDFEFDDFECNDFDAVEVDEDGNDDIFVEQSFEGCLNAFNSQSSLKFVTASSLLG